MVVSLKAANQKKCRLVLLGKAGFLVLIRSGIHVGEKIFDKKEGRVTEK